MKKILTMVLSTILIFLCASCSVHEHTYSTTTIKPTCTERGYTTYVCDCGESFVKNYTEPTHQYEGFKCVHCGIVGKKQARQYFVDWVKQKGEQSGQSNSIVFQFEKYLFVIMYTAPEDTLTVSTQDETLGVTVVLNLDTTDNQFKYVSYFESIYSATGTINGSTYKSYSEVSFSEYSGYESLQTMFEEVTRKNIGVALDCLDDYIKEQIPEFSVKYFGFEQFE